MKYIWDTDKKAFVPAKEVRRRSRTHHVISDTVEPFKSMADGQIYDSKSRYRQTLKNMGYVELGNDVPTTSSEEPDVKRDIEKAFSERGWHD